jgi:hypothetical protein
LVFFPTVLKKPALVNAGDVMGDFKLAGRSCTLHMDNPERGQDLSPKHINTGNQWPQQAV